MKTDPMSHQRTAVSKMHDKDVYGLFMEQGTGKTWTILADAERLYSAGKIDGLFVIAPNGVHTNWINREIPAHMEVPVIARHWKSGAGKQLLRKINDLFEVPGDGEIRPLRIFAMNIEALITKDGFKMAEQFLLSSTAMFVVDESRRIKNPDAGRTKAVMKLRKLAKYARIATGTPITKAPVDVFQQMEFLESGLLGTTSYRAFVAEYAELMPNHHPMMQRMIARNPKIAYAQVIAKNDDGSFKWRNLDKLTKLLEPYTYRVLKKDCLDLPEKIYKVHTFDLEPKQLKAYNLMRDELRMQAADGKLKVVHSLAAATKLQQITSGFIIDQHAIRLEGKNARLSAFMDMIGDIDGQFIVWARFKEELKMISEALIAAGCRVVQYHGDVNHKDREIAVDSFQRGDADAFVGQPVAGGIGLTLTAAETVIYYSNDFDLETRLQSEDRAHRKGTTKHVVYIDLVANNTIDETISRSLANKTNMAAAIMGDL